jgi:hypothetical protein
VANDIDNDVHKARLQDAGEHAPEYGSVYWRGRTDPWSIILASAPPRQQRWQIPGSRHPRVGPLQLRPGEAPLTDDQIDELKASISEHIRSLDAIWDDAIAKGIVK